MSIRHGFSYRWVNLMALLLIGGLIQPSGAAFAQAEAQTETPTATAQAVPLEYLTDPVMLVASYYNAINLKDYERAYSYWENTPSDMPGSATEAQFAAGFADTEQVAAFVHLPVDAEPGAGNVFAAVPILLDATHTDGSEHVYAGCITAHKVNVPVGDATEPDPNWHLRDATLSEVDAFDLSLLDTACDSTQMLSLTQAPPENLTSPVGLLASYFGAIAQGDYARAFSYWENPPEASERQFAEGFDNTTDVGLVLRLDITVEGAAGSVYSSLPALVTATDMKAGYQYFAGCYVARKSNVPVGDATEPSPDWHLYSAHVNAISYEADGLSLLQGVCAQ